MRLHRNRAFTKPFPGSRVAHAHGERQGSGPIVEVAAALVVQGSFGLMLALLWSRYRNIWLAIAAHVIANGYAVVVFLGTGD